MKIDVNGTEHEVEDEVYNAIKSDVGNTQRQLSRSEVYETAKQDLLKEFKGLAGDMEVKQDAKFKDVVTQLGAQIQEKLTKVEPKNDDELYKEQVRSEVQGEFETKFAELKSQQQKDFVINQIQAQAIAKGVKEQYLPMVQGFVDNLFDLQFDTQNRPNFRLKEDDTLYYVGDKPASVADVMDKVLEKYQDIKGTKNTGDFGSTFGLQETQADLKDVPLELRIERHLSGLKNILPQ